MKFSRVLLVVAVLAALAGILLYSDFRNKFESDAISHDELDTAGKATVEDEPTDSAPEAIEGAEEEPPAPEETKEEYFARRQAEVKKFVDEAGGEGFEVAIETSLLNAEMGLPQCGGFTRNATRRRNCSFSRCPFRQLSW